MPETNIIEVPNIDDRFFSNVDTSIFGPPPCSGVYAVCFSRDLKSQESILYIGSSLNMKRRMLSRRHPYMKCFITFFDCYIYTKCFPCEDYIELEKKLIAIYKPLMNNKLLNG